MLSDIVLNTIDGFLIGHARDQAAATGCTVIISREGATAGVDVRGGAPGTRETDLLNPVNLVETIHAVFLAGGSAFGLDAAAGIMRYLEENRIGFDVQVAKVPIVAGAVLFDLTVGKSDVRPDGTMGYAACLDAERNILQQGNVGAGTGASVGKIAGPDRSMKSGIGCCAVQLGELKVGALVAVNCLGDVVDPDSGKPLAGVLNPEKTRIMSTEAVMMKNWNKKQNLFSGNTTIGAVLTNGRFTKSQAAKLAAMAHNGYARTLRPAHSMFDGDTIFAMASGKVAADVSVTGMLAARVVEKAVVNAVIETRASHGLPGHADMKQ